MKRIGIKLSLFDKLHFEQINTKYYHYIISGDIKRAKCCRLPWDIFLGSDKKFTI